jgi:hypothetical protein
LRVVVLEVLVLLLVLTAAVLVEVGLADYSHQHLLSILAHLTQLQSAQVVQVLLAHLIYILLVTQVIILQLHL